MLNVCQAVTGLLVAWSADRTGDRYWHGLVAFVLFAFLGYLPLAVTSMRPGSVPAQARLFFLVVSNCGSTATLVCQVIYRVNTGRGTTRTVVGTAAMFTGQAVAGVVGPFLYPNSAAPAYTWGMFTGLGLVTAAGTVWAFLPMAIRRARKGEEIEEGVEQRAYEEVTKDCKDDPAVARKEDGDPVAGPA